MVSTSIRLLFMGMKINISFLEGSGDTTETVNGEDSDGTTIPKLTLTLGGGGKTESFGDEEESVSEEEDIPNQRRESEGDTFYIFHQED